MQVHDLVVNLAGLAPHLSRVRDETRAPAMNVAGV